ncbi:putative nitronate monooxygenase [Thalassobacillus devorans]|uniref:Probable nitronate monooxygenase n=1 Tax=Thalassobacillus devorans TaxID=279813 RepID=A0ABQ1PHP5_9BACI|nr:nitronate monooxygenase [Thalassobacillus devorans]NIK29971.1 nitronate monooxygenase [Thalassobacillus devorans]GGC97292.1 putative nitronate monooxygenase [Thalassobacillus devorans]
MWQHNEVTSLLNIKFPIIQAGMAGGVTTPELVAAVSNAGGLGTIGAGYMTADALQTAIRETKKRTDKPFSVNVFVPEESTGSEADISFANALLQPFHEKLQIEPTQEVSHSSSTFQKQLDVIVEEKVPVCSFTFGVPSEKVISRLKSHQIRLIGTATTVKEAIINGDAGIDLVVAQGSEAGGHRGTFAASFEQGAVGIMSLVQRMAARISIPVIAAGGIMDARGFVAVNKLGAKGVQMGTAFLTSPESGAKPLHKQAILKSDGDDTVLTRSFSGKPARGIENDFVRQMRQQEHQLPPYPIMNTLTKQLRKAAAEQNKPDYMSLWAGQNASLSRELPAGQLIRQMVKEVKELSLDYF